MSLLKRLRSSLFNYLTSDMAIDLGTANTLVYLKNEGIVLDEPSVVAFTRKSGALVPYAFGHEAKMMLGRTPGDIHVKRPLQDGVIADFFAAEEMIKYFINKAAGRTIKGKKIVICVPSGSTPVERRAIQEAAEGAGGVGVFLIEETMAAAIGAGLPVTEPRGSMIVDIGGGTTEVGVISLGGVVYSSSTRVGGDKMDEAIGVYVRRHFNLLIGESTAEMIKKTIGVAHVAPSTPIKEMRVKGRDLVNGLPKEIILNSEHIADSLREPVNSIIQAVRLALETAPPELSADIVDSGIVMTGGGALLGGLKDAIAEQTKLPVVVADCALQSVVLGSGKVLEEFSNLKHVLFKQE